MLKPLLLVASLAFVAPSAIFGNWASNHPESVPHILRPAVEAPWIPFLVVSVLMVAAGAAASLLDQPTARRTRSIGREKHRLKETRRQVLHRVERDWIGGYLEPSLQESPRIPLTLVDSPSAIEHPWGAMINEPGAPEQELPPETSIHMVFTELSMQLLILGAPGAGKTTLLLELVQKTIRQARANVALPIPVVFHLSSWGVKRLPLEGWIIDELNRRYGVEPTVGELWVREDAIIAFLDGLDEVRSEHRAACVQAINDYHDAHGHQGVVVCSRTQDYERARIRLRLQGAVSISPLSKSSVTDYLQQDDTRLARVRGALESDEQLWELLTTPLMLRVAAYAYADQRMAASPAARSSGELRNQLFGSYIQEALNNRRGSLVPSPKQVYYKRHSVRWLTWLARAMLRDGQRVFHPGWMRPGWLPGKKQLQLEIFIVMAATRALVCTVAAIVVWSSSGPLAAALFGFVFVWLSPGVQILTLAPISRAIGVQRLLPTGVVNDIQRQIHTLEDLEQAPAAGVVRTAIERRLHNEATFWATVCVLTGFTDVLLAGASAGLLSVSSSGLGYAVVSGLVAGILGRLLGGRDLSISAGIYTAAVVGLIGNLTGGAAVDVRAGALLGFMVALFTCSGIYLTHFVLRGLLVLFGHAPWNYVGFLEYASDRNLLRRVGADYLFVHQLLQEYLAGWQANVSGEEDESEDLIPIPPGFSPSGYEERIELRFAEIVNRVRIFPQVMQVPLMLGNLSAAWLAEAKSRQEKDDQKGAAQAYTNALKLIPGQPTALICRANARFSLKAYWDAIDDYAQFIALRPNSFHGHVLRGLAYERIGYLAQALADFDRAISLQPDSVICLKGRIRVHQKLGHATETADDEARLKALESDG